MPLPRLSLQFAFASPSVHIAPRLLLSISPPLHCNTLATPLPRHCHAIAIPLPFPCHSTAISLLFSCPLSLLICIQLVATTVASLCAKKMPSHPPSAWEEKESVSRTMLYKKVGFFHFPFFPSREIHSWWLTLSLINNYSSATHIASFSPWINSIFSLMKPSWFHRMEFSPTSRIGTFSKLMRVELINGGETVDARPISEEKFPWI